MNDLGRTLVWAALQVTVVGLVALVLYGLAARRAPGAAARVAALYLGLTVVLTTLALCPLPGWWTWTPPSHRVSDEVADVPRPPVAPPVTPRGEEPPADTRVVSSPGRGEGSGWSVGVLRAEWEKMARATPAAEEESWSWPGAAAIVVLVGTGLGLARLLLGAWSVHLCCRRSREVNDPTLKQRVENLRSALGCRRVTVRESSDLASPATAGWLRPVVLLPADWRSWDEADLRAVLAHELAHVRHWDYLAGVVARLGVALHFYNPLVQWLTGRLRMQQELAADALGARLAGGPGPYVQALARLALRQDDRPFTGPATAFLSPHGTLMRRIAMLRAKERSPHRPPRRLAHAVARIVLVGAAIAGSALRSPAQKAEDNPLAGRAAPSMHYDVHGSAAHAVLVRDKAAPSAGGYVYNKKQQANFAWTVQLKHTVPEAFDLRYLSPDAMGVYAFRPAAVFGRPEMRRITEDANNGLIAGLKALKVPVDPGLRIEDVEQLAGRIVFQHRPKEPKGRRRALICTLSMIRTVKDFDWKKQLHTLLPGLAEVKYRGQVYYRMTGKSTVPYLLGLVGGNKIVFLIPDRRTLVCESEPAVRAMIDRRFARPEFPWDVEWKHVERGVLAVAVDMRWAHAGADPDIDEPAIADLVQHAQRYVFGADLSDRVVLRAHAAYGTARDAGRVLEQAEKLLHDARAEMKKAKGKDSPRQMAAERFAAELLMHTRLTRDGRSVHLGTEARTTLPEVIKVLGP